MRHEGDLALEPLLAMSALKLRLGVDFLVVLQPGDVPEAPPALLAQELVLLGVDNVLCFFISLFFTILTSRSSSLLSDAHSSCSDYVNQRK